MSFSENGCDPNPIPWPEMFKSAASPRSAIPPTSRSSPALMDDHSFSLQRLQQLGYHGEEEEPEACVLLPSKDSLYEREERAAASSDPLPNDTSLEPKSSLKQLFRQLSSTGARQNSTLDTMVEEMDRKATWSLNPKDFQLAIYVAMAHAILVALVVILYGLWKLLEDYQKPIQWAVLCSMPLRQIQKAMVEFWETPLKKGMLQTAWAIPAALCKAVIGTLMDARFGLHSLQGQSPSKHRGKVEFSTLMQWLVSFAFFTFGYELLGPAFLATAAFVGMLAYAAGTSIGIITPMSGHLDVRATLSMLSSKSSKFGMAPKMGWLRPILRFLEFVNTRLTSSFVGSLHSVIAIFLISMIIIGSLAGLILFSYKVGLEGKDAVVALKSHIEKNNYADRIGLKQWIEDYQIPELIDTYAARAYETVSEQIDIFLAQYNLTDLAIAGKKYIPRLAGRQNTGENISALSFQAGISRLIFEKFQSIRSKFRDYDFKGVYYELEQGALFILEHLHISREDLIDKAKQLGQRWADIGKQVVASCSTLVSGSTYVLVSIGYSIASGAAGIIHFITQTAIFFSVLYYLIVSETGGVMKQVLGMVPLSESMMVRCATVLESTVSNVLLSTAKAAVFQATFTWLLFRFFNIHFLYMSTLLALFSALLSLPRWLQAASLLAGVELLIEGQYVQSILLMVVHTGVVLYGLSTIQKCSPGDFTGLSLAVGVVLFWPSLEGAIMCPLFITLLIAIKNLYLEVVLATGKEP